MIAPGSGASQVGQPGPAPELDELLLLLDEEDELLDEDEEEDEEEEDEEEEDEEDEELAAPPLPEELDDEAAPPAPPVPPVAVDVSKVTLESPWQPAWSATSEVEPSMAKSARCGERREQCDMRARIPQSCWVARREEPGRHLEGATDRGPARSGAPR